MEKKDLIKAAEELNEVLGLEPPIDTTDDVEILIDKLLEAVSLLREDDEVSDETRTTTLEMKKSLSGEEPERSEEPEEPEEPEESEEPVRSEEPKEPEEPEEPEEFQESLYAIVSATKKLRDLKILAAGRDEFKTLRKNLDEIKGLEAAKELKKQMLKIAEATAPGVKNDQKKTPQTSGPKVAVPRAPKGEGVVTTIASLIEDSGEKGITKAEILNSLQKKFPDREENAMKSTVNTQLGGRIKRERFPIKNVSGRYKKVSA